MKHILPSKRVFIIHTVNMVANTLNFCVMMYALLELRIKMPGHTFEWTNVTDSDNARYISIFLCGFMISNVLCFVNVAMLMSLINNYLDSESEKKEDTQSDSRRSLNTQVYFNHCIELSQAIESEIDKKKAEEK